MRPTGYSRTAAQPITLCHRSQVTLPLCVCLHSSCACLHDIPPFSNSLLIAIQPNHPCSPFRPYSVSLSPSLTHWPASQSALQRPLHVSQSLSVFCCFRFSPSDCLQLRLLSFSACLMSGAAGHCSDLDGSELSYLVSFSLRLRTTKVAVRLIQSCRSRKVQIAFTKLVRT